MGKSDSNTLIKDLERYAKAKNPIDANLLGKIPYFMDIFPDKKLWSVLVRLSKKDLVTHEEGIPYIEHKEYQEGENIITKGQCDLNIYWVLNGHADIIRKIKNQPKKIHEARKGECLGELTVLRGAMRTADVIAGKDGVRVLQFDWSIIDKSPELGKNLYQLVALHLADKLDKAYERQLRIISSSVNMLNDKIADLINKNKKLEQLLKKNNIDFDAELQLDKSDALIHAIANIKESLSLLERHKDKKNLDILGII